MKPDDPLLSASCSGSHPQADAIHRFAHEAMATRFEIHCTHPDAGYAAQAADAAFDLVERLERELSRFRENSDVSRINSLHAGQELQVGGGTMEILVLARCFYLATGGAFDISLGTGLASLELFPADLLLRAGTEGIRLDLGGIGKGYAVDRAAELLEEWGIRHALLHAGFSSVLALDAPPGREGWTLTMSRPGVEHDAVFERLTACRQALSSSGIRKGDHILDPRPGQPVRNRPGAWISGSLELLTALCRRLKSEAGFSSSENPESAESPSAAAEALSTAFMILPLEQIESGCRQLPGLQAWILERDAADPAAPALLSRFPRHVG